MQISSLICRSWRRVLGFWWSFLPVSKLTELMTKWVWTCRASQWVVTCTSCPGQAFAANSNPIS